MTLDLFSQTIDTRAFRSPAVRIVPVEGEHMAPTLRGGIDAVAVVPCSQFVVDGLYVLDLNGHPIIYRVQDHIGGYWLISDNPSYPAKHTVSPDDFAECVLGQVVAEIRVTHPTPLRRAWEAGQ